MIKLDKRDNCLTPSMLSFWYDFSIEEGHCFDCILFLYRVGCTVSSAYSSDFCTSEIMTTHPLIVLYLLATLMSLYDQIVSLGAVDRRRRQFIQARQFDSLHRITPVMAWVIDGLFVTWTVRTMSKKCAACACLFFICFWNSLVIYVGFSHAPFVSYWYARIRCEFELLSKI